MIDDFSTDRDQEERLKMFWRENWRWMVAGVVLGVAALIGWRWWQSQQIAEREAAAAIYAQIQQALSTNNHEQAAKLVTQLAAERGEGPYVDQARLSLAKLHVEQARYDEAAQELRSVVQTSEDPELAALASLRLARVLMQQGKHDEALAAIKLEEGSAYAALAHEVRGDVHFAKGDTANARQEYAAALEGDSAVIDRPLVEMKLQQVGGAPATAAAKSES